MHMYLLDTNVVSELRRQKPHGGVVSWMKSTPATALFVPAIVFEELQAGVELTRLNDPAKATAIEIWISEFEASANTLPATASIARETVRLMSGRPIQAYEDAVIAATAVIHEMTVVTQNTRDFTQFPVKTLDPFKHARR